MDAESLAMKYKIYTMPNGQWEELCETDRKENAFFLAKLLLEGQHVKVKAHIVNTRAYSSFESPGAFSTWDSFDEVFD